MGDIDLIVKRIKERRLELNLSYQDIADATGLSKSTIQRYETGSIRKLPVNQIEDIAKALHVTPGYLMGWEDTPGYYTDPETARLAQEAANDPDMRLLLDAKRDLSPEDMKVIIDMAKRLLNRK